MKKLLVTACILGIVLVAACKREITYTNLDNELTEKIEEASNGQGLAYFQLPYSNDYSNIPQDPNNPITYEKVMLGKLLFHETALGTNPRMPDGGSSFSCASCHHAGGGFQANLLQGISEGGIGYGMRGEGRYANPAYHVDSCDVQPIRTPSAMNGAWQRNQLWNGQFGATHMNVGTQASWAYGTPIETNYLGYEGLETQAIAGLTVHRLGLDSQWTADYGYQSLFDIVFNDVPTSERYTKEMAGLAIAAFERTIISNEAPFQHWLRGDVDALTDAQKRGAAIFFGKGNCTSCHTGPALNSEAFYAIGVHDLDPNVAIIKSTDDAEKTNRGRGGFTGVAADDYKFKVPQLYNLTDSRFFGHGGRFTSVYDMMVYKNEAVAENPIVPAAQLASQFVPLNLTVEELEDLTDFLENGLYDPNLMRYQPTSTFSGMCIPNNDPVSQIEVCMQ